MPPLTLYRVRAGRSLCLLAAGLLFLPSICSADCSGAFGITLSVTESAGTIDEYRITEPASGKTIDQRPVVIGRAGNCPAGTVVEIRDKNAAVVGTATTDSNSRFRYQLSTALELGANELYITVNGESGPANNITVEVASQISFTEVPQIVTPQPNETVRGKTVMITGKAAPVVPVRAVALDRDTDIVINVGETTSDTLGNYELQCSIDLPGGCNAINVCAEGTASRIVEVNFVDPYGVVFDAVTNNPVEGARVTMWYEHATYGWRRAVPGEDILAGESNPQITGADGQYAFTVTHPPDTNLRFEISASGYKFPTTRDMARFADRFFDIQAAALGEIFPFDGTVLNIDIPLDPEPTLIEVTKTANKQAVVIGEVVTYTLSIENKSAGEIDGVIIEDLIPPGFKYLDGTTVIDGLPHTDPLYSRPLDFTIGSIRSGEKKIMKYQLVVGSGVACGKFRNIAFAKYADGTRISNQAIAEVEVAPDELFELGTIIGKVFNDANGNGIQDDATNEPGIAHVRLVMENGTVVITDENGLYHIPGVQPGRHIVRLDERTLPKQIVLTGPGVLLADVRPGLMAKINFAVGRLEDVAGDDQSEPERFVPALTVSILDTNLTTTKTEHIELHLDYRENSSEITADDCRLLDNLADYMLGNPTCTVLIEGHTDRRKTSSYQYNLKLSEQRAKSVATYLESKGILHDRIKTIGYGFTRPIVPNDTDDNMRRNRRTDIYMIHPPEHSFNRLEHPAIFAIFTNYDQKIESWSLEILDRNGEHSLATLCGTAVSEAIEWDGKLAAGQSIKAGETYAYRLRVMDSLGNADTTGLKYFTVGQKSQGVPAGEGHPQWSANQQQSSLEISTINSVAVTPPPENTGNDRKLTEGIDEFFFVALTDGKAGYNDFSGSTEPVADDDRYNEGLWSEGRLAYYLKAKIKGKYLITSSLDTDRQAMLKNVDPDKYYPVYGDASVISYDGADTSGKLFAMVEWDRSNAVWGNYSTGLDDTRLAAFNKRLYGAKAEFVSAADGPDGKPDAVLILFGSELQNRQAHNEILATGTSLYYLRHRNIIEGSETLKIEIRDSITGISLSSLPLENGVDYDLDYNDGRLLFERPITATVRSSSLISTDMLDGNDVYIIVDYEYDDDGSYNEGVTGLRSTLRLNNWVKVGATYIDEGQSDRDYGLKAADADFGTEKAKLHVEYAASRSESLASFASLDGGLSFTEVATGDTDNGRAFSVDGETAISDRLILKGYYRETAKGFSTPSTLAQQGTRKTGVESRFELNPTTTITAHYDTNKLIDNGNKISKAENGAKKTATTAVNITRAIDDHVEISGEIQNQKTEMRYREYNSEQNDNATTVAAQVSVVPLKELRVYARQQITLKGERNNQTTAGIDAEVQDNLRLNIERAVGNNGNALNLGLKGQVDEHTEVFGGIELADDDDSEAATKVVGVSRDLSDNVSVAVQQEQQDAANRTTKTNVVTLRNRHEELTATIGYEKGQVEYLDGTDLWRHAVTAGLMYEKPENLRIKTALEYRLDDGTENLRQVTATAKTVYRLNGEWQFFSALESSTSKECGIDGTLARNQEATFGTAYRPISDDRLNLIGKYVMQREVLPAGQENTEDIDQTIGHVFALDIVYDISPKWRLTEKGAVRYALEEVAGLDDVSTTTWLWGNRIDYWFSDKWGVAWEYRLLRVIEADDLKQGIMVEVTRKLGDNFILGLGYDFCDFSDDLTDMDYTAKGPFIRIDCILHDGMQLW